MTEKKHAELLNARVPNSTYKWKRNNKVEKSRKFSKTKVKMDEIYTDFRYWYEDF